MHLKSVTLRGFKSFPDRTRLDFGPGVSVIVGPNGSGKSNVTDAVLWAMGEQSPLAVRGQSMQDVIFGGGRGVQARTAAEVEIVLDNGDGTVDLPLSEIAILRRLDNTGEGEYRLNGARCRLVDVIEVLSDTGLGKEMHSVISQGRVEAIVSSKPRDRRLLVEEAAGLGKHRKRRRRAQLKLERTQENLDRALDIEREARSRLRPLKRQAEAAELHARLERQTLEVRFELAREAVRARLAELERAAAAVVEARAARERSDGRLAGVIARREQAENELAQRSARRDAIASRVYAARSAAERLELRAEQLGTTSRMVAERAARAGAELASAAQSVPQATSAAPAAEHDRIALLEGQLAELEARREAELAQELAGLEAACGAAGERAGELEAELAARRAARDEADARAEDARAALRAAERAREGAQRESARVGAELAAVNQFLRAHAAAPGGARALRDELQVAPGCELALAAALGGRLSAALVEDLPAAQALLQSAGADGGSALVVELGGVAGTTGAAGTVDAAGMAGSAGDVAPPPAGARRLLDLVRGPPSALTVAARLLAGVWLVDCLEDLPDDFEGIAVTTGGRVWTSLPGSGGERSWGELRQVAAGGAERVLARRNERERLIAAVEAAAQEQAQTGAAAERAAAQIAAADEGRDAADRALRDADRLRAEAVEAQRRSEWLIEQRRSAPRQGPLAVRRAEIEGELAAERRQAEWVARERAERERRLQRLRAQLRADEALGPLGQRLVEAVAGARGAVAGRLSQLESELAADQAAGEGVAAALRECAVEEVAIQAQLRSEAEEVTRTEVAAQRLRDQADEAQLELAAVARSLELEAAPREEPLDEEEAEALAARLERLARRREQIGPVNPLAEDEYREALAHVQDLEERRTDLETALRELRTVIRDTDREIQRTFEETFQAAARNFEELVGDVFPGGRGRLRLVTEAAGPRPVLGGAHPDGHALTGTGRQAGRLAGDGTAAAGAAAGPSVADAAPDEDDERDERAGEDLLGVEIEVTPAGKSTKRLSLLSGGEKAMTALAFLFAVFLARPCPFYILDEVEAALDDVNLDRFLALLRRYGDRTQFIVITHQKRTMEAADWLYGVSMSGDGVSKVVSRRLPPFESTPIAVDGEPEPAAAGLASEAESAAAGVAS